LSTQLILSILRHIHISKASNRGTSAHISVYVFAAVEAVSEGVQC